MSNKPKIHFFGGAREVDGSCYMVEVNGDKILVDCGLHQSGKSRELNKDPFPFNPKEIKALIITHSHIDHIGLIPKLYRDGFRGKIYSTPPTKAFSAVMLEDSQGILEDKEGLIYSKEDIERVMTIWDTVNYHQNVDISPYFSFAYYNSGHILGSAFILLVIKPAKGKETRVIFSGDLGNKENFLFPEMELLSEGDYCLIESTYGDRLHEEPKTRKDRFEDIIEETIRRGGTLMIPAFAMERTQELLFELNELVEKGRILEIPIFVDSPLAIKITDVHRKFQHYFRLEAFKVVDNDPDGFFDFPGLKFTPSSNQSKAINNVLAPKIIMAGAGSSQGGRILHHEKRYLPDPKSTILMVGYQMKNSLGRRILDGEKEVRIHGEDIKVRADVQQIGAYSAHADQSGLMDFLRPMRFSLKKIFVVQGDEEVGIIFASKIKDELGIPAVLPSSGEIVELETRDVK